MVLDEDVFGVYRRAVREVLYVAELFYACYRAGFMGSGVR